MHARDLVIDPQLAQVLLFHPVTTHRALNHRRTSPSFLSHGSAPRTPCTAHGRAVSHRAEPHEARRRARNSGYSIMLAETWCARRASAVSDAGHTLYWARHDEEIP